MSDSHQVLDEDLSTLLVTPFQWVFPKSLAQIISHYDVAEVHLSLTQGQWQTNAWGYPPRSSPPGGGAVGVVYGWSKVRRMISTHC